MRRTTTLLLWLVCLAFAIPFVTQQWWFPPAISDYGRAIDGYIALTLVLTGIIFLLAQWALGYAVWKFGARRVGPASSAEGNDRWELLWTIGAAVLFLGLGFMTYSAWAEARFIEGRAAPGSSERVVIEVTAQQFVWNFRYPGRDGEFGPLDVNLIDDAVGNPVGLDRGRPAGKDDIVAPRIAVPAGREVELLLRSKDVLHNFFVPELRIKLDTVPGLVGKLRFTADTPGTYEVLCSELCGLGHYKMKTFLDVMEPAEFEAWLEEQAAYLP